MNRRDLARHPRGERFRTGAGIVDLESSLNAVLTRMRTVRYFPTASKAFATKRFADTGRLSAGSRMTTTRARDGNEKPNGAIDS
jgi:hypothetical protein